MSEGIQLSRELIQQLLQTIAEHDASAQQDMMVNLQYLCAVAGYLAADYPGPVSERDEILDHLHAFMKHVCDNQAQPQSAQPTAESAAPTAGHSEETDDPAVGIWKPD